MNRLLKWTFVIGSIFTVSAWGAENRIVNIGECSLNDGMTMQDMHEANRRWVQYMNKTVPGGDIRSFLVRAVVGEWEPKFKFIDSFPSLASWSAMVEAEGGRARRSPR